MNVQVPSPAVSIVGRHNSGKTTLIVKLIEELVSRGLDVGSIKHHSHPGFEIDYPGKDSYRHREAGATETIIAAPGKIARVKSIEGELECTEILRSMPGHDIVIVEGYRKSGLPTIELMRSGNETDVRTAHLFARGAQEGWALGVDFAQMSVLKDQADEEASSKTTDEVIDYSNISKKLPTAETVAVITDIDEATQAADSYGIVSFGLDDIKALANFIEVNYVRPRLTVVIQAGGESRRMGRSKATVPFAGRPLITRLIERLSPVADELIITTNEPEKLSFLDDEYPHLTIRRVRDVHKHRGALPGLGTALNEANNPYVAVVACDMVFASPSLVIAEALKMRKVAADVVVPVNKHGFEPFHALYNRDACLPAINRALERGEKRAQSFFDEMNVYKFTQAEVLEAEPMGGCFINVNTPEELEAIETSFMSG